MSGLGEIRNSIKINRGRFIFKVSGIKKLVEIEEVNEGMARYRIMNEYHTSSMTLIRESHD